MKKILVLLVVFAMVLAVPAYAAEFKDMPDNWSTDALNAAVNNGLMSGSDGYIYPDNPMTRAEMATIIARATGAEKEADISEFTDVNQGDWFYSSMAKAVEMKAFNGSYGKLSPNNNITRQEAFVVLARVFGIDRNAASEYKALEQFSDASEVSDWAKPAVNMIVGTGYVGGSDGKLNPLSNITRAEFAAVMNRLVKYYIDQPGDYTPETDGNIMIRCGGVNINKLATDKMVCIGDLSKEEVVKFSECDITGTLVVRGGRAATGGKFAAVRALSDQAIVDVTTLSAEVVDTIDIYLDGAELYLDYANYGE